MAKLIEELLQEREGSAIDFKVRKSSLSMCSFTRAPSR